MYFSEDLAKSIFTDSKIRIRTEAQDVLLFFFREYWIPHRAYEVIQTTIFFAWTAHKYTHPKKGGQNNQNVICYRKYAVTFSAFTAILSPFIGTVISLWIS